MLSLSGDKLKEANIIEAFNSTSRYLDDPLDIYNNYFDGMFSQIYPTEHRLNKTKALDTKAPFLDLNLIFFRWLCFFSNL